MSKASKSRTLLCQECERPIINRLVDNCLYCGAGLSAELKLTNREKDRLRKKEADTIEADRQAWLEREEDRNSWDSATCNPSLFFVLGSGLFFP